MMPLRIPGEHFDDDGCLRDPKDALAPAAEMAAPAVGTERMARRGTRKRKTQANPQQAELQQAELQLAVGPEPFYMVGSRKIPRPPPPPPPSPPDERGSEGREGSEGFEWENPENSDRTKDEGWKPQGRQAGDAWSAWKVVPQRNQYRNGGKLETNPSEWQMVHRG